MTVEANPETLDQSFLDICASAGVTRISIGVQTLEPSLLALLGRRATREQNLAAVELLRTRWQGGVSVDLLAGIPGQTWERLAEDIETVLSFDPQHVSLYSLTREEGTLFDRMILAKKLKEMPAAEQDRLWLRGVRLLRERGFEHYEISNFAPAGLECRHNSATGGWTLPGHRSGRSLDSPRRFYRSVAGDRGPERSRLARRGKPRAGGSART